jgi:hypothetical protein
VIRLYGLRMWVEQGYKQVKYALGWSEYQVRSDQAIRRHWQLVCCAFSHLAGTIRLIKLPQSPKPKPLWKKVLRGKKEAEASLRPHISWPKALRAVRAWLEPWVLLRRFWQAWSRQPPPLPLQQCLDRLSHGCPLYLYATY